MHIEIFGDLRNKKYFLTWIVKILINKCYDIIYKNKINEKKYEKVQDTLKLYSQTGEEYIEESVVRNAISKIDEDLRVLAVLYYYDGLSVKEIAEILEIPNGTVKSRLSRTRKKLYEVLKEEEGE